MSKGISTKAQKIRHDILDLLAQGKTADEVVQTLGCSLSHVQHTGAAYGLVVNKPTLEQTVKVLAMMTQTEETLTGIARECQVSLRYVAKLLALAEDNGMPVNRGQYQVGRPKKK